jgi:transposase-like protein/rubredoxin
MFISKHIPLRQRAYDELNSPKYQKFKTDRLPIIKKFEKVDYILLLEYYIWKYGKPLAPIKRRAASLNTVPEKTVCPRCGATHEYIYCNNGNNGQMLCKVCGFVFQKGDYSAKSLVFICPYCGKTLSPKKDRKHFTVHKCVNKKCPYYLQNLQKLPKDLPDDQKYLYKLHYIYREFTVDFFKMDISELPDWFTSFKFRKHNAHIMGLCLTYHVNLGLSLRKTAEALSDIHNIHISHSMVSNYARTAAVLVKPFVDSYDYKPSLKLAADETYIKVMGLKNYVWFIMDTVSRSILGYHVSADRGVGSCILAMRSAFDKFKSFPKRGLQFIADGYSAYPLAAQQFKLRFDWDVPITPVIGLSNDDAVSTEFRPFKQKIERLNRTFKSSYRVTCGYGSDDGAFYSVSLWVCYYNFLRKHDLYLRNRCLNLVPELDAANNMPAKWQILISLGQQIILSNFSA